MPSSRPRRKPQRLITDGDPYLEPYRDEVVRRLAAYRETRHRLCQAFGNLLGAAGGHRYFGLNRGVCDGAPGVWYREWAPAAQYLALVGDFNGWSIDANPLRRDEFGVWSCFLPDHQYHDRLVHESRLKVHVVTATGALNRIPAYIHRVVQDGTALWNGQYWCPPQPYRWRHARPPRPRAPRIYEAHVGMAVEEPRVGTYAEFTRNRLSRIKAAGYNAVELMAVMEHPYYASFGYHVSNLYAPSSRFGTPEELKELVDVAHGLGLVVFLDLVHSHMVKNVNEGLNGFDGTAYQYFHDGPLGLHPAWDSLLYDYHKEEVLRFLLSNVRYWLEEFQFDGLRLDGVTSMIYRDHGLSVTFGPCARYFDRENVDDDALVYLQLATEVAHRVHPGAVMIAEDVSGLPGLARPLAEGGIGFDYRLAMGIPDYWIKVLKERRDEAWQLGEIFGVLTNRRPNEGHVAYAESHDQALVGDKTIAFWLMDAEMYTHMNIGSDSVVVDRGIALHKLIRLVTFALGGEGYLNFMGNEFGHPEWIDFPREGNGWSYQYARRQWSLADSPLLRYRFLARFDQALQELDERFRLLTDPFIEQLLVDEDRKLLVFRRGPLVLVCNFHAATSYHDHRICVPDRCDYRVVLDSDDGEFGGFQRVASRQLHVWQDVPAYGRNQSIMTYAPARTALVLAPVALAGG